MTRDFAWWLVGVLLIWSLGLMQDVTGCSSFVAQSLTAIPNTKQIITSTNYPNDYPANEDRCWKIKTESSGYVINLETAEFRVEIMIDVPCSNADFLEIRDGYYDTSPLLRKMCGMEHVNLTSTGETMYLRFKSDESVGQKGFRLMYQAIPKAGTEIIVDSLPKDGCREVTKLTAFATITSDLQSPNFPNGYPSSADRCWLIEALDRDKVVIMTVVDSLLEESYSCDSGDFVEAIDGTDLSDRRITIFCGDMYPPGFRSTGPSLLLRFHTDQTLNNYRGFHLQYSMAEPNTGNGESNLTLDQSMKVLIGVGVVVIALAVIFAVIGFYKKTNSNQVHQENHSRRPSRSNQTTSGEATVRLAFESILNQPMSHMTVTQANLRAPPPHQGPERPPTHLGFVAPTQPGYTPWMVPNSHSQKHGRSRHHRRRRRTEQEFQTLPASIQQYNELMYPPGTPIPPEPPPYEDIIKALEESGWDMQDDPVVSDPPIIVADNIETESQSPRKKEEEKPDIPKDNNSQNPLSPSAPILDSIHDDDNEEPICAESPTMPGSVNDDNTLNR